MGRRKLMKLDEEAPKKALKKYNSFPDLIKMGVIKRKLTKEESKEIVAEINDMELKSADSRFTMAIILAIEKTNKIGEPL